MEFFFPRQNLQASMYRRVTFIALTVEVILHKAADVLYQ
jgi:hypothetical protein